MCGHVREEKEPNGQVFTLPSDLGPGPGPALPGATPGPYVTVAALGQLHRLRHVHLSAHSGSGAFAHGSGKQHKSTCFYVKWGNLI